MNNKKPVFLNQGVSDSVLRLIIWLINNFIPYVPNMNNSNKHVQQRVPLKAECWFSKNPTSSVQKERNLLGPTL